MVASEAKRSNEQWEFEMMMLLFFFSSFLERRKSFEEERGIED